MRVTYTQLPFPSTNTEEASRIEFSVVAVKDGIAIGNMYSMGDTSTGLPMVMVPEYSVFVQFFQPDVEIIHHEPVRSGTPWDGEKFLVPDTSDFVQIGEIVEGQ